MSELEWLKIELDDDDSILLAAAVTVMALEQSDESIIESVSETVFGIEVDLKSDGLCFLGRLGKKPVSCVMFEGTELAIYTLEGEQSVAIEEEAVRLVLGLVAVPKISIYPITDDQRIMLYRLGFVDVDGDIGELVLER